MPVLFPLIIGGLFVASLEAQRRYRRLKKKARLGGSDLSKPQITREAKKDVRHVVHTTDVTHETDTEGVSRPGVHSKTEEKCRRILEKIYGLPFPPCERFVVNQRTSKGKKKNYLTLDGYNSSLKLAFEYQGPQHYHYPNYLSRQGKMTREQFKDGIQRDRMKKAACRAAGITLLIIPYTKDKNLEDYIREIVP